MKTKDWETEVNVMAALGALGHTAEHLAIFDDVDLLRQKLETFAPDVLFNLVEQFKNNPGFDQNIVSFFEMQGLPFTGCGSTGLTLCKHKGISKKILHYHGIHVPNFVVIPRGQRIGRPKQLKFPMPRNTAGQLFFYRLHQEWELELFMPLDALAPWQVHLIWLLRGLIVETLVRDGPFLSKKETMFWSNPGLFLNCSTRLKRTSGANVSSFCRRRSTSSKMARCSAVWPSAPSAAMTFASVCQSFVFISLLKS